MVQIRPFFFLCSFCQTMPPLPLLGGRKEGGSKEYRWQTEGGMGCMDGGPKHVFVFGFVSVPTGQRAISSHLLSDGFLCARGLTIDGRNRVGALFLLEGRARAKAGATEDGAWVLNLQAGERGGRMFACLFACVHGLLVQETESERDESTPWGRNRICLLSCPVSLSFLPSFLPSFSFFSSLLPSFSSFLLFFPSLPSLPSAEP